MGPPIHNFNAGPAVLPKPVLEQVQQELLDFGGSGMSILEMSHRSTTYEGVHNQAIADLRTLLNCPDDYAILFMSGGGQTQFALVAMNLLPPNAHADYLVTGNWSESALKEAQKVGDARALWSGATSQYDRIPLPHEYDIDPTSAYLHYTSNNTIVGTQFALVPESGEVPLVCDMSSYPERPYRRVTVRTHLCRDAKKRGARRHHDRHRAARLARALPVKSAVDFQLRGNKRQKLVAQHAAGLRDLHGRAGGALSVG